MHKTDTKDSTSTNWGPGNGNDKFLAFENTLSSSVLAYSTVQDTFMDRNTYRLVPNDFSAHKQG
jgi:hypothetical protein